MAMLWKGEKVWAELSCSCRDRAIDAQNTRTGYLFFLNNYKYLLVYFLKFVILCQLLRRLVRYAFACTLHNATNARCCDWSQPPRCNYASLSRRIFHKPDELDAFSMVSNVGCTWKLPHITTTSFIHIVETSRTISFICRLSHFIFSNEEHYWIDLAIVEFWSIIPCSHSKILYIPR